jgi:aspartate aminotransferase-like enzyme
VSHIKLFIPGPVEISDSVRKAFGGPMIGHRGKGFQDLYARVQPGLRKLFQTNQPVFLGTGSAWSVMEASLRNLVLKKVLVCMNGAFSDKWFDVALKCGKEAGRVQVEWGQAIKPELIDRELAKGGYDTLTLIHHETSTGTLSPLVVDTVSSFSVLPIPFDELGLDVMLCGTQKALALPPGAALFVVSERAYQRAEKVKDRGYYYDFLEFRKQAQSNMTPCTPSISHLYALEVKLLEIEKEGIAKRYERHRKNAERGRAWLQANGFEVFPEKGYESLSLTCGKNTRGIDLAKWIAWLKEAHHAIFDGGYGKLKGQTFRVSHMGDETEKGMEELWARLREGLKKIS